LENHAQRSFLGRPSSDILGVEKDAACNRMKKAGDDAQ
jgi:hypothetical protein